MQSYLELDVNTSSVSQTKSITRFMVKYKVYFILLSIALIVLLLGQIITAIGFAIASTSVTYIYRLWKDISSISFVDTIDGFSLQDVINDLEMG